jgi:drug/metabolite transporter (DMT)-like permease
MELAVLLAVAASVCTATASVCQRLAARSMEITGFDAWLVFRLARHPVWLLGFTSMLAGFGLQVAALHFGPLALVQPIMATELLFVFGYLAAASARRDARRIRLRDWLAVVATSAGISVFLRAAAPSGGRPHAPASLWWLAGLATAGCVLLALALAARLSSEGRATTRSADSAARRAVRKAAVLGAATGIAWGFVAAVIKELTSHISQGLGGVFGNWAVYVLMAAGAIAMLLASHAIAAGPLAASQPGFTIGDPLTASLLGLFLFGEVMQTGTVALTAQVAGLGVLVAGVAGLSHSRLITGEQHRPGPQPAADGHCQPPPRLPSHSGKRLTALPGRSPGRPRCPARRRQAGRRSRDGRPAKGCGWRRRE